MDAQQLTKDSDLTDSTEISVPTQFVVQRNHSLSWRGNKIFIIYIAILSLGIAMIFALQGMWLILPFAGLEIIALTLALYFCCLRCSYREVITIDDEKLFVETGRYKPKEKWQFERAWLQLVLKKSTFIGYPSQLLIRSKGRQIEIGKCLTNKERKSLAESLVTVLQKPLIRG